ncbi:MAG: MgtC/SapB transporter [Thermoleophilia bacterium]|nr:MgtC/SapB transporter [Thermoleophilia bacterium]
MSPTSYQTAPPRGVWYMVAGGSGERNLRVTPAEMIHAATTVHPPELTELELILRLAMAALLGAVIGVEREWRDRTAGLRTHMLVCLGSTAFTIMSAYGFSDWYGTVDATTRSTVVSDPTRIAAQIVTGIGFLGAGAIFRSDDGVRGLTTAASLWMMAAIGLATGAGFYELAVASTVMMLIILVALRQVSGRIKRINRGEQVPLEVIVSGPTGIAAVFDVIAGVSGTVSNFTAGVLRRDKPSRRLTFDLQLPADGSVTDLVGRLALLEGVDAVSARDMPTPEGEL